MTTDDSYDFFDYDSVDPLLHGELNRLLKQFTLRLLDSQEHGEWPVEALVYAKLLHTLAPLYTGDLYNPEFDDFWWARMEEIFRHWDIAVDDEIVKPIVDLLKDLRNRPIYGDARWYSVSELIEQWAVEAGSES